MIARNPAEQHRGAPDDLQNERKHRMLNHRFHASKHVRLLFRSFQRGLPHLLPGQHWYVVSSLINALGSGLYYPFAVLYGHQVCMAMSQPRAHSFTSICQASIPRMSVPPKSPNRK
jgi:hypothetical protein